MQMSSGFRKMTDRWLTDAISSWELDECSTSAKLQGLVDSYHTVVDAQNSKRPAKEREVMAFNLADWCVRKMIRDLYENKPVCGLDVDKKPLEGALEILTSTQRQILIQELYEHLWFIQGVSDRAALMWKVVNEHALKFLE